MFRLNLQFGRNVQRNLNQSRYVIPFKSNVLTSSVRCMSVYNAPPLISDPSSLPKIKYENMDLDNSCIRSISPSGIVAMTGVPDAKLGGLINIHSSVPGVGTVQAVVVRINAKQVYANLLDTPNKIANNDPVSVPMGDKAYPSFPVGLSMVGRVVDSLGRAIDDKPYMNTSIRQRVDHVGLDNMSPPNMIRDPSGPFITTGIKQIDLFHPIRRGMRVVISDADHQAQTDLTLDILASLAAQDGGLCGITGFSSHKLTGMNVGDITAIPGVTGSSGDVGDVITDNEIIDLNPNKNVFVWVCVNQSHKHQQEVLQRLTEMNLMQYTTMIVAKDTDPAAQHHNAFVGGIALANHYRTLGMHCTLVVDDMSAHAQTLTSINETASSIHPSYLASQHAYYLESVCSIDNHALYNLPENNLNAIMQKYSQNKKNVEEKENNLDVAPDSDYACLIPENSQKFEDSKNAHIISLPDGRPLFGSVTALLLAKPLTLQEGPKAKRHEVWHRHLRGIGDHYIRLNGDLKMSGVYPPIDLSHTISKAKHHFPVFSKLNQILIQMMYDSKQAHSRVKMGKDLGISLDYDVLEVDEWLTKAQVLLNQPKYTFTSLHMLFLSMFALSQYRMLAGIHPSQLFEWEDYLVNQAQTRRGMLVRLRDEVNMSIYMNIGDIDPNYSKTLGKYGLSVELEEELAKFVDETHDEFLKTIPCIV